MCLVHVPGIEILIGCQAYQVHVITIPKKKKKVHVVRIHSSRKGSRCYLYGVNKKTICFCGYYILLDALFLLFSR